MAESSFAVINGTTITAKTVNGSTATVYVSGDAAVCVVMVNNMTTSAENNNEMSASASTSGMVGEGRVIEKIFYANAGNNDTDGPDASDYPDFLLDFSHIEGASKL